MDIWEGISNGSMQAPLQPYEIDKAIWSEFDDGLKTYADVYLGNMAPFWHHYVCSIPYLLEEQCRLGYGLVQLLDQERLASLSAYMPQGADGTDGRSLVEYSEGRVLSVTGIDTEINRMEFLRKEPHEGAQHVFGHFQDEDLLSMNDPVQRRHLPFDLIYCNVVFQFLKCSRTIEIGKLKGNLKPGGLFMCIEKLLHSDNAEYRRRELLKDSQFKSRYFSEEQLREKDEMILQPMRNTQVEVAELVSALKANFSHVALLWNSLNFYEFAASDSPEALDLLVNGLPPTHVPQEWALEDVGLI